MNNNKFPRNLRRRIALLLVVSIFNVIASPFFAGFSTQVKAAPPFQAPTDFIRRIPLATNDLVYSSATGKIYASVPSSAGSGGNSIVTIDPATGAINSSTFIGSEPTHLTISDDGQSLYAWLDGSATIRRFDTLTNTPGPQFSMGQHPNRGRLTVRDFAVAPANPSVLAVARYFSNFDPAGVAIFDNGVQRPNVGPSDFNAASSLAFSASAAKLYGSGQSHFQTMTVDASGVTVSSTNALGANSPIQFSNGLIFTAFGQVINPDTNTLLGTFAGTNTTTFVADGSVGRAYYLTSGPSFSSYSLKAFDINTFVLLGSLTINGVDGSPTPLIRWGANGLAFRTHNELFIIQTSLIPSAESIPTPTPTPLPTPLPSPSPQAPAFVRQMTLTTNDLVFSQATQKIYASVPSSEGSTGNTVTEIDPVSGTITNQTFVGSEPAQLGQADDGTTLYVGLDGSASIRSYNILNHTAGAQFPVGRDDTDGPYSFSDIAVTPGNPLVIAVARQKRNVFPSQAGVAIFDNGVQRPNTGATHSEGSRSIAFASPSILYGNNFLQGLTTMSVDNSGVIVTGTSRFQGGTSMILANGLLYGSFGEVINPATGELIGTFTGSSMSEAVHAVDTVNGRVFFIVPNGSGVQLRAYDINTFLPLGFVNISGFFGAARDLVRWGTNGLAFRTDNRKVFLIETALVNASVVVPSPTPTPSPTPSPSPPYIPTFVRRVNLPANNLVFSEATQALYASLPSSAGASGNTITKINPETGAVGPSVFIGSEPNRMAISSDGQTLWVHLNGANAARRFDVLTETPGLQFATSSIPPTDMEVVPGSPESVVMSRAQFGGGVAIYDSGIQRPNTGNTILSVGPIEFGASPSVLYGYNAFSSSFDLVKFLVDSSGVTTSEATPNLFPQSGNAFEFVNGLLYTGSGRVVDPEGKTWLGKFPVSGFQVMAVDAANQRVFYAAPDGLFPGGIVIRAFDLNTFLPLGSINLPGIPNQPVNLIRWGANGLAFNTATSFGFPEPNRVYLVQSDLVSDAGSIPIGLELERDQITISESESTVQVKVTRTGDDSGAVSVNYATTDGTAIAGSDYTATSGTLNFAPGELTKFISIPLINDTLFENANETFTITLSNPTNSAILLTSATTTVTINDNEGQPFVSMSASPIRVTEGDSGTKTLTFRLSLSNASVQVVTVDYATVNGTATAGSDYVAASGTVTIPAGSLFVNTTITINGDTTVEPNETFNINVSNATNVSFLNTFGALAIIDNDDASLQLSNTAITVNEGAGFATVTVTRVGDTSRAATVLYSTTDTAGLQSCTVANGKASERCDYATAVGRIQFALSQTSRTFTVPIVDDALVEGDETFTVNLSSPTGATPGAATTATITVVDNDSTPATQNPADGVTFYITQQYIDFLGRLPDTVGLANWTDTLGNCPNGGFGEFENPTCDRVHVSAGFFLSDEFRGRG
ncbi:MAG TPA: Calx-beta domain-containing protein, partial [Pyrinomonadaceae bacterium]|nr:Calx-beta domain-containing protein [Pyrinomonadaceae bacterium]